LDAINWHLLITGGLGALLHETSRWVGFRYDAKLPAYIYRIHYWLLSAVLVLMGALLAWILAPTTIPQALAIGISAPAIVSRLGAAAPRQLDLGPGDDEHGLQSWFRG
jgi:hypothetical protein